VNSTSLPEPLVFFVDRSLGRKVIPNALREANERVKTHDELFAQDTPDETWLKEAGRQGWIVLTKDTRIRYHANEIAALLNSQVRAFVLTARGDLTGAEMAAIFIKALPAFKRMAGEIPAPSSHESRGTVPLKSCGNDS
jgi:hypothetical protein